MDDYDVGYSVCRADTVGLRTRARKGMQSAVDAGLPVVFFPEGTTSNGSTLLKFHSGLLAQAMQSGAPITAAHIWHSLTEEKGADVTAANDVSWWGDAKMQSQVFKLLGQRGERGRGVRWFAEEPIAFSTNVTHLQKQKRRLSGSSHAGCFAGRRTGTQSAHGVMNLSLVGEDSRVAPFVIQQMFTYCEHAVTTDDAD